ncbi:hypothetical protein CspeluHIS016_0400270 [Cutaneotrichosporon spelunceum]|uniref:Uncharacterized protein n=1 Tax=Cutaneotrichosporon spelunceum TaxID=1672016 RepID=A0AAD3TUM5_9TREE|nr:hypothetical protein CspeluHIS016_0400270 [Cutaneotrichosporon spelunceum]
MPGSIPHARQDCKACPSGLCTCGTTHDKHAHTTSHHQSTPWANWPHGRTTSAYNHYEQQTYCPVLPRAHSPSAPYSYNSAAPYHCQPHACGPHAACDPAPCGPAHAHTHPAGNCHDVSLLLGHLNQLSIPIISYACTPHPPHTVCLPRDTGRTPLVFEFHSRLVRDHLHHPLMCYLAEGISPGTLTTGLAGTKIHTARQLLGTERPDGYRALQAVVYSHVLLSLNVLLLEETARNKCIDHRRHWTVSSPCDATHAHSGLELQIGSTTGVALEVHPTTVVSNSLMDAALNAVKLGAAFDKFRGRVVAELRGDAYLHFDALALLSQVWVRFGKHAASNDATISWVVLSNLERSIVFRRTGKTIQASHVIHGNGVNTPRDSVQNFYSLLLALSVLEKQQYHSTTVSELVHLI